jgi:hypothetical protein
MFINGQYFIDAKIHKISFQRYFIVTIFINKHTYKGYIMQLVFTYFTVWLIRVKLHP